MSLFTKLSDSFRSWRRRRGGPKTTKRATVTLEHLGHRQLLAVNFTGNVITDFPASQQPGVVVLPDNASVIHPIFSTSTPQSAAVAQLIKVSGFDINEIRVSYTPGTDTLSIGLGQPNDQKSTPSRPVLSGDADNNGNSGTTDPAVTALISGFVDSPDLQGSETMGAFLKLNPLSQYDIVAGYPTLTSGPIKQYTVALAADQTSPGVFPGSNFGTALPGNRGNVYLVNDPSHPNFEFDVSNFSKLYLAQTGQALTANSVFSIGAFGSSLTDTASGALYPLTQIRLGDITPPVVPPVVCPPLTPNIMINPHEARHVNSTSDHLVRVYVYGSSGFPVGNILPETVLLGGATPVKSLIRKVNHDQFPDEVFFFKGSEIKLPGGITNATLTGKLTDPNNATKTLDFSSTETIFNRDSSFPSPNKISLGRSKAELLQEAGGGAVTPAASVSIPLRAGSRQTSYTPVVSPATPSPASDGSLKPLTTKVIPLRNQAHKPVAVAITPTVAPIQIPQKPATQRGSAARSRHINNVKLKTF